MRAFIGGVLCMLFPVAGCSPARVKPPPPAVAAPQWSFQAGGVDLHLRADPQLNLFHQTPHTLLLCIYQLRDANSFDQLKDDRDGLQRLLDCGRFDQSVLHARRIVLQPGQEIRESLDRPEGARVITIAAGYFSLRKEGAIRTFPVPLQEERRGETAVQLPQKLGIDLYLGPKAMQ